ncbi:MAG: hypothetical protein FWC50_02520 [Planctomycetaceae bacterium]|nr:hypothetical protein [Planctomycetaceae bacterium]
MSNEAAGALGELVDLACIMDESLTYGMQTPEEKADNEAKRQAKIDAVMAASNRPPYVPPPKPALDESVTDEACVIKNHFNFDF